jgi:N-acetylglucosamine-6-phosphate deacetylase
LGHSDASYSLAQKSYNYGAKGITHLFNAMRSFHHRAPGIVGFALNSKIFCEVIPDGEHLTFETVSLILKAKNYKNIIFVSDGMEGLGFKKGVFQLAGRKVFLKKNRAILKDGTLAGSITPLIKMHFLLKEKLKLKIMETLPFSTYYPAKYLNLKNKGEIKEGNFADLCVVNEKGKCVMTMCEGEVSWLIG